MEKNSLFSDRHEPIEAIVSRRRFLIGSATLAGGVVLAACSGSTSPSTTPSGNNTGGKKYTVVFIAGIQGVPFYNMVKLGAQDEATKKGVTLQADAPAQWDPNLQTQIVNAYIAKNVDAIIIAPCDNQVLVNPLKQASDKGIKVVTVDTFLGDGNYTTGNVTFPVAYVGSDNVKGGNMAGVALIKAIGGKGKVYLQNNAPGASTAVQRAQGFKDALAATNGAVTLVGENFDGGDIAKATAQTAAILQSHPDLAGIFGATAYSAEGAAAAVKNANKSGVVKVAHFDSSEQSIIDLRNGTVDLVIGQLPKQMGTIALDYALQALTGDSSKLQRHVSTDFIVIDKNNVDTPEAQAAVYK
ncbi:MAG TPA: ABC transporter substrate-binding protein [Ktedonosporobacter sp.]|nr:ABC transporter substrate-binding protein [Ktedonosporobacter sp.]